ncbi:MAG: hypothetical protein ACHQ1G_09430, partial [Planctomycetota bacterium]
MKKLAILLLLAAPVLADDDAASLFYKGFWLEQAEGKLDEAAALYGKLLAEKPDAPEAPRALLGLIRIKVARNEDPKELVAELERRYPAAKQEIEGARGISATRPGGFAEPIDVSDSGVERKIKFLYQSSLANLEEADRKFLIDVGVAGHPMLAALLRGTYAPAVEEASEILVAQKTPEAHAVLARALLDDAAPSRAVIVEAVGRGRTAPLVVVEAMEKLYERASPRLRTDTVGALLLMAASGDGRDRACAVLTRALGDADPAVRARAGRAVDDLETPDIYVDTLLRRLEAKDPAMADVYPDLPGLADRAGFRKRLEAVFDAYEIDWRSLPDVPHEEGALLLARCVARELRKGNRDSGVYNLAYRCAGASPKVAADLLLLALDLDDTHLVSKVASGMGQKDCLLYLGDHAGALRAAAVASAPGPDEPGKGAPAAVIALLGLGPPDFQAVKDALRRRRDRGMPALLLDQGRLDTLGIANAAALVEFCRDEKDARLLLSAGRFFAGRDDAGVEFFRMLLPRLGPSAAHDLGKLARYSALAPLVAERLLAATGPEWGWAPVAPAGELPVEKYPGPWAWRSLRGHSNLFTAPPLQPILAQRVEDPRFEIAVAAATAAAADKTEAGTDALRKSLLAMWPDDRAGPLRGLAARDPDAPALVRVFAKRPDLVPED